MRERVIFHFYIAPKLFQNLVSRMISCKMSVTCKHVAENLSLFPASPVYKAHSAKGGLI